MQKTTSLPVEKDLEVKAYIYQQLVELQPYLLADSQVAVGIEEVRVATPGSKRKKVEYLVTLTASIDEGEMEVEGQGADFYQAFAIAKDRMVHELAEIQDSLTDAGEREMIVRSAMNGGLTIH